MASCHRPWSSPLIKHLHNTRSSTQPLLLGDNNTGRRTTRNRPPPPLLLTPTATYSHSTPSISFPSYSPSSSTFSSSGSYCPNCLHSLESSLPLIFQYPTITTSPISSDYYEKEYPPLCTSSPSTPMKTSTYLKPDTTHINQDDSNSSEVKLFNYLWFKFKTKLHTTYTPTHTQKTSTSSSTYSSPSSSPSSFSSFPCPAIPVTESISTSSSTSPSSTSASPPSKTSLLSLPSTSSSTNKQPIYTPAPHVSEVEILYQYTNENDILTTTSDPQFPIDIYPSSLSLPVPSTSNTTTANTIITDSTTAITSNATTSIITDSTTAITSNATTSTNTITDLTTDTTDLTHTHQSTTNTTATITNTKLQSFIENIDFYLSYVAEHAHLFDGTRRVDGKRLLPGTFLSPERTDQHIQKQLSNFTKIAKEITTTLGALRVKIENKHVLSLYSSIQSTLEEFEKYYKDFLEDDPKNPVLHYSHYNYPSPHFQQLFDIIFQPQVIEIVQKYYLQTKCSEFKCSNLCDSFTPTNLDLTALSRKLLPFQSNITLEPILHTLYCYSYLSFICSKPPTLDSLPLHTFCTQNHLLSFECIIDFFRLESIRSDPEYIAESITANIHEILEEILNLVHHTPMYEF